MKLSFVIPAYNEAIYLPRCLASIQQERERYPQYDVEVIVVNNASTDNTRTIVLNQPNVILVDEPIKGLSQARQSGYLRAAGELIANIDADTMLKKGWLNCVFSTFEHNSDLLALSGPVIYYDLPRYIRGIVRIFYWAALITHVNNQLFRIGAVIQGGNFVLRRSALEQLGGYNTSIVFYGEDADVARRLSKLGKVRFTLKFPIYASGRRLAAEGVLTIGLRYTINYLWIIFFKRPFSKKYADIRPS